MMNYKMLDEKGCELDFFFEMSKYAGYLRCSHLSRHLAIYELYKKTIYLPGSIAEFGIFNGSTFFFLARLIEIFNSAELETNHASSRSLFGFDSFEGFGDLHEKDQNSFSEPPFKGKGGLKGNRQTFYEVFDFFRKDSQILSRLHVIEGKIEDTFAIFMKDFKSVRFCFCLMDLDLYAPTRIVLDSLYELMVPGGIIVFDEYGFPLFPGETAAVDEFLHKYDLPLLSFPWTYAPAAYTIIPRGKRHKLTN